jgi:hypothetical protein
MLGLVGPETTGYVSRLFDVEGLSDDDDTPLDNALEEGVPVRINRADSRDGSVLCRIGRRFPYH